MYDFSAIKKAKEDTKDNYEKIEEKFNTIIDEALIALDNFASSPCFDLDNLSDSMNLFVEAIELKKNRVEPYFYLSYIFYLLKETTQAVNYLTVANNINPNFNGLNELREKINQQILDGLKLYDEDEQDNIDEDEIIEEEKLEEIKENTSKFAITSEQTNKIKNTVNNYNSNKIKAYSNSFKDKIYKLGTKF